jgi:hypothetical protein
MATYGCKEIKVLAAAYGEGDGAIVDAEELLGEWEGFRRLLKVKYSSKSARELFKVILNNESLKELYPQMMKLAAIAALIPMSTAECERVFSTMNRIKTDLRNRLKTNTLDCLIRLSFNGPPADLFDFERAADIWGAMRNRRLTII